MQQIRSSAAWRMVIMSIIAWNGIEASASAEVCPQELVKLIASDAVEGDQFGSRIAMSGDTAVIGAQRGDPNGSTDAGSAYVFSLECEAPLLGDLNEDGMVDGADLGILLGAWGTDNSTADLNDDGNVDGADLGIMLGEWGS
jgi:hypothetical protein